MPDLQTLLDQIQERATRALGDEPHPHLDGPLHAQWIDHQRQCAEGSQRDAQRLLAALQAVIADCDEIIEDADKYGMADRHLMGQGAQARATCKIITDALGADHD